MLKNRAVVKPPLIIFKLVSFNVFVNNLFNRTVFNKCLKRIVYLGLKLGVFLCEADCVILGYIFGVKNLKTLVCGNISLCGLVINNNAVNLAAL